MSRCRNKSRLIVKGYGNLNSCLISPNNCCSALGNSCDISHLRSALGRHHRGGREVTK